MDRHLTASWETGQVKTTLDLPDELIREVKLRAVIQRRTVKDLVAEFPRQGLGLPPLGQEENRMASSKVKIGENGLPVIQCTPNAPATHMNAAELLALEQQSQNGRSEHVFENIPESLISDINPVGDRRDARARRLEFRL